jgi:hypothetical protein
VAEGDYVRLEAAIQFMTPLSKRWIAYFVQGTDGFRAFRRSLKARAAQVPDEVPMRDRFLAKLDAFQKLAEDATGSPFNFSGNR